MRTEWRCHFCQALLGIEDPGGFEIKNRDARWRVRGARRVDATCARCGQISALRLGRDHHDI